jgi:hypothetical protein
MLVKSITGQLPKNIRAEICSLTGRKSWGILPRPSALIEVIVLECLYFPKSISKNYAIVDALDGWNF